MMKSYNYELRTERQKHMKKYILKKDIPGCKKGTIFVHDKDDDIVGSVAEGCLKLAWTDDGNCQEFAPYCGGTFILHASVIKDSEWFEKFEKIDTNKETIIKQIVGLLKQL